MFAAALLVALSAAPVVPATDVRAIDAREKVWDGVEPFVDSQVCGRYKAGHRAASSEAVQSDANLELSRFVDVRSCSLRALQFHPSDAGWDSVFLFEVDGIGFDGERRTLRGEADVQLDQRADGGWHIARNTPRWKLDIERKEPLFEHLTPDQTGFGNGAEGKGPEEDMRHTRGGLGVLDVDGDGRLDLFVTIRSGAQLYLNKGALRFEKTSFRFDPPKSAQPGPPAIGDFDNDGDPDVIVALTTNQMGAAYVFRNDKGKLKQVGTFPVEGWVASAIPWDWNRDGKLDLTLIRYLRNRSGPDDFLESTNGRTPLFFEGRGDLTFKPVKVPASVVPKRSGLAGVAAPLDALSEDSLYLANDYGSNDLLTFRDGGFVQRADERGLRDPGNGMSADVGDVNADGQLDLYVANMFSKAGTRVLSSAKLEGDLGALLKKFAAGNTLYLSNGDGGYSEVGAKVGVNRGLWAWGSPFIDANDDGRLDMAVANGFLSRPDRKDL